MSETNSPPGEDKENSVEQPKKRWFEGDFLAGWLLRRERPSDSTSEEEIDESDEESEEKKEAGPQSAKERRTQKFLNWLFARHVSKEPAYERPSVAESSDDTARPVQEAEAGVPDIYDIAKESSTELRDPAPEVTPNEADTHEIQVSPPADRANEAETPASVEPPEAVIWEARSQEKQQPASAIIESRKHLTPEKDRAGVGMSLVVDQLSRRRDRKLKRAINRAQKRMDDLRESGQKLEKDFERSQREVKPPYVPNQETVVLKEQITKERAPLVAQKAERNIQAPPEIEVAPEKQSDQIKLTEPLPEAILTQVQKAAEKNVPIEALFERSHELKDQPSHEPKPIGAILNDMGRKWSDNAARQRQSDQKPSLPSDLAANGGQEEPDSLYKQAVTGGVVGAIFILVLFAVIIFLV